MELVGLAAATVIGASWMLKFIMSRFVAQSKEIKELRREVFELATNHIAHSTQAMIDMRNVAQQVLEELRRR